MRICKQTDRFCTIKVTEGSFRRFIRDLQHTTALICSQRNSLQRSENLFRILLKIAFRPVVHIPHLAEELFLFWENGHKPFLVSFRIFFYLYVKNFFIASNSCKSMQ